MSRGHEVCFCGHVEDEHADNGTCTIDGCLCGGYEADVNSTYLEDQE